MVLTSKGVNGPNRINRSNPNLNNFSQTVQVHNIPEGLAVSMVLSSKGVSPRRAMLWSIITSLPQPLVAVPAYMFAETFTKFLPLCMGFAAGCMIWMVFAELLPDSLEVGSSLSVRLSS